MTLHSVYTFDTDGRSDGHIWLCMTDDERARFRAWIHASGVEPTTVHRLELHTKKGQKVMRILAHGQAKPYDVAVDAFPPIEPYISGDFR